MLAGGKINFGTECILIKLDWQGNEVWRKTYFIPRYKGIFIIKNGWFIYAEEDNEDIIAMVNIDAQPNAIFIYFPSIFILLTWLSFIKTDVAIVKLKL